VSTPPLITPGFFGKVPALGDFVSRALPRAFLEPWDAWLQEALHYSRQQLGEDAWLNCYLSSPLWHFALSAGLCGSTAWAGVLMPSVDRVGRYYPLVIAVPLPARPSLLGLVGDPWFEQVAETALLALDERLDMDAFTTRVQALGLPAPGLEVSPANPVWHCPVDVQDAKAFAQVRGELAGFLLELAGPPVSLWWGSGSEQRIDPCLLVCYGLPPPHRFAGLLAGDWQRWGWNDWPPVTADTV
jgi:type VI secretion system protein ImpM